MAMSTNEAMTERLDGLERENRRLRWIATAMMAGALSLGAVAIFHRDRGAKKLETQQLVLRDQEGRLRGSFGVDEAGLPSLKVYDHRGLEQVMLGVQSDDMAMLSLSNRGATRILLDTSVDGYTSLRLFDPVQNEKASLVIKPDNAVGLRLAGGDQALRLGIAPDGRMTVLTTDSKGREVERIIPANYLTEFGRDLSEASGTSTIDPGLMSPTPSFQPPRDGHIERVERRAARGASH
jgi:hypothetical protein